MTFYPDHYAVTAARDHDYPTFFQKEIELREQLGYPPFSYLACLRVQGNHKQKTDDMARKMVEEMIRVVGNWPKRGKELQVLGPVEAPLSKLKGGTQLRSVLMNVEGKPIVYCHCRSGGRALTAAEILRKQGFEVRPLKQGYDELTKNGFAKANKN